MAGNDEYTKLLIHSDTIDDSQTFIDSSSSGHTITVNNWPSHQTDQKKFGSAAIHFRHLMNMDDAFTGNNGDLPDREKWTSHSSYPQGVINSNKLRQVASSVDPAIYDKSNYKVTADFDVSVGFDVSGPDTNSWAADIRVEIDSNNAGVIQRGYWAGQHGYYWAWVIGGTPGSTFQAASETSGYLRLYRSGTTWIAYYWDSGWQQLGDSKEIGSGDVTTLLRATTSDGEPTVTVDWDDFQWNEGTEPSVPVTNDYLTADNSVDWDFGSGDFTIDFWMYPTDNTSNFIPVMMTRKDGVDYSAAIYAKHTSFSSNIVAIIRKDDDSSVPIETNAALTLNTWQHIAFVRNGDVAKVYKNGTEIGSADVTGVTCDDPTGLMIGHDNTGTNWFSGYIDEFRISKGIARWTSNFTPPARAYGGFGFGSKAVGTFEFGDKVDDTFIFGV